MSRLAATLQDLFDLAPATGRPALRVAGRSFGRTELEAEVRAAAAPLRRRGLRPGHLVGIALPPGPEQLIAARAVIQAGGAFFLLDPTLPAPRRAELVAETGCAFVLDALGAPVPALPAPEAELAEVAAVFCTSGSTGRPKAVPLRHRSILALAQGLVDRLEAGPDEVWLGLANPSFDAWLMEFVLPFATGATLHLGVGEERLDGAARARLLRDSGATLFLDTPTRLRNLLDAGWWPHRPIKLLSAGEPLTPDLAAALLRRGLRLYNVYGPTEVCVCSNVGEILGAEAPIPVGPPLRGVRVEIEGEEGEICIGGPGVARGYLRRPELGAGRFGLGPDGEPSYRSGDLGRWRGRELLCLGRIDRQVKVRGQRIEPGEVESRLRALGAREAVVFLDEDGQLGAAVVGGDPAALRAALAAQLPPAMVPARIHALAHLPQTPSGKVDLRALPRSPVAAASPDSPVAAVFDAVLGRAGTRADDDFFAIGGHSLRAVELLVALERRFGRRLGLADIFRLRTPAALEARLAQPEPPPPPLPAAPPTPSFEQERLAVLQELEPDDFYHLRFAVEGLPRARAEAALSAVVARHPALRSSLHDQGRSLRVHPPAPLRLDRAEVGPLDAGPALRAGWEEGLVLALHHAFFDAWSAKVFLRDLDRAARGEALPPLAHDPSDLAAARRARWTAEAVTAEAAWWREGLAGLEETRLRASGGQPGRGSEAWERRFVLDPGPSAALRAMAAGRTLYAVLAAAWAGLLHAWTDNPEGLLIATLLAGRARPEAQELIGFFANTALLPLRWSGWRFADLVAAVHARMVELHEHGDVPFDRLVAALRPERRDLQPLARVFFGLIEPVQQAGALRMTELLPARSAFDLAWEAWDDGERIGGRVLGRRSAFGEAELDALARDLEAWLGDRRPEAAPFAPRTAPPPPPLPPRPPRPRLAALFRGPGPRPPPIDPDRLSLRVGIGCDTQTSGARVSAPTKAVRSAAASGVGARFHAPTKSVRGMRTPGASPRPTGERGRRGRARAAGPGGTFAGLAADKSKARSARRSAATSGVAAGADQPLLAALDRAAAGPGRLHVGEESWSYAELRARADRGAAALGALGLRPGDAVVLGAREPGAFAVAFWACLRGSFPAVPAPGREADAIELSGARAVADEAGFRRVAGPEAGPDHAAVAFLTAGSSGRPKAVPQDEAALAAALDRYARGLGLGPEDVFLNVLGLDHVAPLLMSHLVAIWLGADQVQAPAAAFLARPALWLDLAHHHRATSSVAPGFAWDLVREAAHGGSWDLRPMRALLNGGETVKRASALRFNEALAPFGLRPDAMRPGWGMSETCACAVVAPRVHDEDPVPLGEPLPGLEIRVVDEAGALLPEGEVGRLLVAGPGVLRRYWGPGRAVQPVAQPFDSGDLARLGPQGLVLAGRARELVVVHGAKYAVAEVEAEAERVAGVPALAVPGREDRGYGLVLAGEAEAAPVRAALAARFGAGPRWIRRLAATGLPRGPFGKVDRAALADDGELDPEATLPAWSTRSRWIEQAVAPCKHPLVDGRGWRLPELLRLEGPCTLVLRHAERHSAADPVDPEQAALAGAAWSLGRERGWDVRVLDTDEALPVEALAAVAGVAGAEPALVVRRAGRSFVRVAAPYDLERAALRPPPAAGWLVVGGLGGVGRALVERLLAQGWPVVTVGRSPVEALDPERRALLARWGGRSAEPRPPHPAGLGSPAPAGGATGAPTGPPRPAMRPAFVHLVAELGRDPLPLPFPVGTVILAAADFAPGPAEATALREAVDRARARAEAAVAIAEAHGARLLSLGSSLGDEGAGQLSAYVAADRATGAIVGAAGGTHLRMAAWRDTGLRRGLDGNDPDAAAWTVLAAAGLALPPDGLGPAPAEAPPPVAAPASPREGEIARIFAEILDVPAVDPARGFFDLGGNSLLLPRLQKALAPVLGREPALVELFRHPSPRALAAGLGPAPELPDRAARMRAALSRGRR